MAPFVKHLIGYGVALVLLGLAIRFAVNEHIDKLLVAKEVEQIQKVQDARDQARKEADARFDEQIKNLKTPQQAQPIIQRVFLPSPGQNSSLKPPITVRKEDLSPQVQAQLPDAPSIKPEAPVMILTPDQQVFAAKEIVGCQKVGGDLSDCEKDKLDKDRQIKDLKKAVKGGHGFKGFLKAAKCLGVSGLSAGVGALIDKGHPAAGATIGAVGGGAACQIFF